MSKTVREIIENGKKNSLIYDEKYGKKESVEDSANEKMLYLDENYNGTFDYIRWLNGEHQGVDSIVFLGTDGERIEYEEWLERRNKKK